MTEPDTTDTLLEEADEFVRVHPVVPIARLVEQLIERVRAERQRADTAEAINDEVVLDADLQRLSYMAADARARRAEAELVRVTEQRDTAHQVIRRYGEGFIPMETGDSDCPHYWYREPGTDDNSYAPLTPAEVDTITKAVNGD